ncbi:MAG: PorP/SprF family type IX secretion system membrane protein [Flavobacteriales bacterium]|nr:PorP/SprF family type IX secretion system membrane protein [Flavobacteriales bacterium]
MKKLILLTLIPLFVQGQQDPQFTFNNDYNSYSNPSFMVNDYKLNVTAQHRQQWVGFKGRPITTLVNASYRVDKAWSAFGVSVLWDMLGAQHSGGATLNYAFDGKIGEHHIVPGIQMGLLYNTLDGSKLDPIQENDPNIVSSKSNGIGFDLGLSLAYMHKGLAIGFSGTHITAPTLKFEEGGTLSEYTVARHFYGYASYEALLGTHFRLKPISFAKTDGASTQFDQFLWFGTRNLNKYFDGVSLGLGYRIDDAVATAIEFKLKWFTLGYSYDITTSGINNYSSGSHEMYLRVHLFNKSEGLAALKAED